MPSAARAAGRGMRGALYPSDSTAGRASVIRSTSRKGHTRQAGCAYRAASLGGSVPTILMRFSGANIQVPLGVWDLNAFLPEQSPDLVQNFALHIVDAMLCVSDPETHFKLDRTLAEGQDKHIRCWRGEDPVGPARCLAPECNQLVKIGVMRNPHRDLQPHALVVVRPVDHLMGDYVLVGNEELCAIAGLHGN